MAQKQALLPFEALLQIHIAFLEHDVASLQAQLMLQQAAQRRLETLSTVLAQHHVTLPVPLSACTFDQAQGCLWYDWEEPPGEEPLRLMR